MVLLRLAVRNLLRNRRRTGLTVAAVLVGVFAVVGVRGFLNGLQAALVQGVTEGNMGALQVHRRGHVGGMDASPIGKNLPEDPTLLARIQAVPGVKAVAPRIGFGGLVNAGDETLFAQITAVDPATELKVTPKRMELIGRGGWLKEGEAGIIVGVDLWEAMQAEVGKPGAVLASDVDGILNGVNVRVAGGLKSISQQDRRIMIMPLRTAQELLRLEGRITEIAIQVHDVDDVENVAERVRRALGEDYEVHTWRDLALFVRDVQRNQNAALSLVTVMFMFVMLMGIANALLMAVLERVREIGTMMAVGTRRRQVLLMFLWEAALIGAVGALLGGLLGAGIVGYMGARGLELPAPGSAVPQIIRPYVASAFLLRMVLTAGTGAALAALYPAWKASRLRPVDALGHV
ncbi:MAG: ABC transporter permease [Deltaproteobacteria bacterium]|nr:ABC transporter permease [Deltaproteobacteria bacterium]